MFDNPEFLKSIYGFVSAAILGIAGVGYRKVKEIDSRLDARPTKDEVESILDSRIANISLKQDYTIEKIEDLKSDVIRLEEYLLRGNNEDRK